MDSGTLLVIQLARPKGSNPELMKQLLKIAIIYILSLIVLRFTTQAQPCTPLGDETTYGSNDVWRGYAYQSTNFTSYKGYVTEGIAGNPNFDQSFGGNTVNYATNGCSVYTEVFSMRYKLTKTFASGNYDIVVGGDDGYRLSLDGGATWVIDNFNVHSYTTSTYSASLNGTYNMVLEFYENNGDNRVSFNVTSVCVGSGNPATYGAGNIWKGYIYQGMNFNSYRGFISAGNVSNMNFDESFGSDNVIFPTSNCSVRTENFSVRYRLQRTFSAGTYVITIGGDDGYRLSLDGGATWVINKWVDQSYAITTYTGTLSGSVDMVLEYYENGGGNRISFNITGSLLPVKLLSFTGTALSSDKIQLVWKTASEVNFDKYIVQRSTNGQTFQDIYSQAGQNNNTNTVQTYSHIDQFSGTGNVYYRIAMVDKDGSIAYSSIVSVTLKKISETKLFPTVVDNGMVFVESSKSIEHAKFELFDMSGRALLVKTMNLAYGRQQVSLKEGSAQIAAGSYMVRISDNSGIALKSMIVIK